MRKCDNENFKQLFETSKNLTDLAKKLGYIMGGKGNLDVVYYREIKRKCHELGLDYNKLSNRFNKSKYDDALIASVPNCLSIAEVIKKLGFDKKNGSLHSKIKNRISFLRLNTDHFTGQLWSRGKNRFNDKDINKQAEKREKSWEDAFSYGSSTSNGLLLKRLVLSGKREYKCSVCGIRSWNGKPIRLHLDHINGDNLDAREENLRIICPNCDSQTDTFCRGKKKKKIETPWWTMKDVINGQTNCQKDFTAFVDKASLIEDLKTKSAKDVGKSIGVSESFVIRYCKRNNIKIPYKHDRDKKFNISKGELERMVWENQ